MPPNIRAALAPLLITVALVACGPGGDAPVDGNGSPMPTVSDDGDVAGAPVLYIAEGDPSGEGLSVAEAIEHQPTDDIVVVSGALFVDPDGTVRLCDAILESFPPQCGGASLRVEGLDLESVDLEEANGVRWAEGVTLLGSVE